MQRMPKVKEDKRRNETEESRSSGSSASQKAQQRERLVLKECKRELHTGTNKIMMCQLLIVY